MPLFLFPIRGDPPFLNEPKHPVRGRPFSGSFRILPGPNRRRRFGWLPLPRLFGSSPGTTPVGSALSRIRQIGMAWHASALSFAFAAREYGVVENQSRSGTWFVRDEPTATESSERFGTVVSLVCWLLGCWLLAVVSCQQVLSIYHQFLFCCLFCSDPRFVHRFVLFRSDPCSFPILVLFQLFRSLFCSVGFVPCFILFCSSFLVDE